MVLGQGLGVELRISDCQSGVMEVRGGVRDEAVGTLRVSSERRDASESGNLFRDKCSLGKSSQKNQTVTWTSN